MSSYERLRQRGYRWCGLLECRDTWCYPCAYGGIQIVALDDIQRRVIEQPGQVDRQPSLIHLRNQDSLAIMA
jgi:hypothetical protein